MIKVGVEGTYQPYTYHDEDGNLTGFDVDVAKAIAEKLGVEVDFTEADWDSLLAGIDSGRIDTVINAVSVTDERKEKYDFAGPYFYIEKQVVIKKGNDEIKSWDDLKGKKFRVQPSEANIMTVTALGAAATTLAYSEVYTALQNHVIDCASNPEMALVSMKHGEVAPYYSYTEHQIFTDMLMANSDFLNSLSEEEQAVFHEAFQIANTIECEEWDKQIEEYKKIAQENMGVTFIKVDKTLFSELEKPVKEELLEKYPEIQPLYDTVQKIQGDRL